MLSYMPGRILPLVNNEVYHIFNRGSDKRDIFLQPRDYRRFVETFYYYQFEGPKPKFSALNKSSTFFLRGFKKVLDKKGFHNFNPTLHSKLIEIFSYCLMPNHFHFLVKQLKANGISIFMSQTTNSYTKYFNTKFKRVGSLLQGTFKSVRVGTDEQLIHVSRYIHINPVVSGLVSKPQDYQWSSYLEYAYGAKGYCSTDLILGLFASRKEYRDFTEGQIDYGKRLELIKHQIIDDE